MLSDIAWVNYHQVYSENNKKNEPKDRAFREVVEHDNGWFDGHVLQTLDGVLIDGKLGINDQYALRSSDGTMLGGLNGVVNGVILIVDNSSFDGVAL